MAKYLDYEGLKYLWSKIEHKTDSIMYEFVNISLSTDNGGG